MLLSSVFNVFQGMDQHAVMEKMAAQYDEWAELPLPQPACSHRSDSAHLQRELRFFYHEPGKILSS